MGLNFSSEEDEDDENKNLLFYSNQIPSKPWPGYTITEMLLWCGDYSTLENNHSYIQWLFPIPGSRGMNSSAQPLYEHEAKAIREHHSTAARVLIAYRMMLDFYGMRLVDYVSGEVIRNEDNWKERYKHLNTSTHNYRRITRIITSLGELGYERFQVPWITFLMEEAIVRGELPNLKGSCMRLWIEAIKDPVERETMKMNYFELFKRPELCKTDNNHKSIDKSGKDTYGKQECINSDHKSEEEVCKTDNNHKSIDKSGEDNAGKQECNNSDHKSEEEVCKTDNTHKAIEKLGEDTDGKQECNNSDHKSEEEVCKTDNNHKSIDKSGEDTDVKQECSNSDHKSEEEVCKTDNNHKSIDKSGEDKDGKQECSNSYHKSEAEGIIPDRENSADRTLNINDINPSEESTIREIEKEDQALKETMTENVPSVGNGLSVDQIRISTDDYKDGKQEENIVRSTCICRSDDNQHTDSFQSVPETNLTPFQKPYNASCSGQSNDLITFDESVSSFPTTFDSTKVTKQSDGD